MIMSGRDARGPNEHEGRAASVRRLVRVPLEYSYDG
jgi:hypothetical protein